MQFVININNLGDIYITVLAYLPFALINELICNKNNINKIIIRIAQVISGRCKDDRSAIQTLHESKKEERKKKQKKRKKISRICQSTCQNMSILQKIARSEVESRT